MDVLDMKRGKMMEHTSRFYELIPHNQYKDTIAPSFIYKRDVDAKKKILEKLVNIEMASKIMLAALHKSGTLNPYDYVHNALRIHMQPLRKNEPSF